MINTYTNHQESQTPKVDDEGQNIPDLGRFHDGGKAFHEIHEAFPDEYGVRGLCAHLSISIGDVL